MTAFTPSTPPAVGVFAGTSSLVASTFSSHTGASVSSFTPTASQFLYLITYGYNPVMDGSIMYGQLVGGPMNPTANLPISSFTPHA